MKCNGKILTLKLTEEGKHRELEAGARARVQGPPPLLGRDEVAAAHGGRYRKARVRAWAKKGKDEAHAAWQRAGDVFSGLFLLRLQLSAQVRDAVAERAASIDRTLSLDSWRW